MNKVNSSSNYPPNSSYKNVTRHVQRVRELPYVDVPPLTKVVCEDRSKPPEKENLAYVTRAPIEQNTLGQDILEEILKASLNMTIGQVLGASPAVRKELGKQITKVRQPPDKDKTEQKRSQFKATVEDVSEEDEDEEQEPEKAKLKERILEIPDDGINVDDLPYAPFIPRYVRDGRKVVIAGDPVVQYLNSLGKDETPKQLYAKMESFALRAVYPVVNNLGTEEALLDSSSQIVSMARDIAVEFGLTWNPDIVINMESAQGHIEPTLGLARDVPFQFGDLTILLQIHIINKPAYKILLGRPFDPLTESEVKNKRDGAQTITLHDPASQNKVVLPTYPRGQPPKSQKTQTSASF